MQIKNIHLLSGGIYDYPAGLAIFMNQELYASTFGVEKEYFNGYFSETEITDIDESFIATKVTEEDLTKTSRQLKLSMGSITDVFTAFGVVMSMLIIYLLSKIIVEKNAQSISMTKILGYNNGEINGMYVYTTSIVVIASIIVTIPLCNSLMGQIIPLAMSSYSGWLPYCVPFYILVEMAAMCIGTYIVIAFIQMRRVKKIPLADALKNVE